MNVSSTPTTLALAAGMGTVAAMRSMSALALLARRFAHHDPDDLGRLAPLATPPTPAVLQMLAAGEMVADKTPFVPDRTEPPAIAGRTIMGALSGVAIALRRGESPYLPALLGASTAAGATFLAYHLRKDAAERFEVPGVVLGVVEDATVLLGGSYIAGRADEGAARTAPSLLTRIAGR